MNQNQPVYFFTTSKQNIGQYIENILEDKRLGGDSVVKNYLTTAVDGKDYNVTYYALDMMLRQAQQPVLRQAQHSKEYRFLNSIAVSLFRRLSLSKPRNLPC